jgi:hypothetical protein
MAQSNSNISSDILRLTVPAAAKALGISPEAVRNRLSRGSLDSVKENRTVYVLLDNNMVRHADDQSSDRPQHADDVPHDIPDPESSALISAKDEIIADLREQLSFLRAELLTRNEELRRKDHIIAAITERIPELEPASAPREGSVTPPEDDGRGEGREGEGGPSRRPWWRRLFESP